MSGALPLISMMAGLLTLAVPADAREACAGAFHNALTTIRSERAPSLSGLPQRLSTIDASWPGRWLFAGGIAIPAKRNNAAVKPTIAQSAPAATTETDPTDDERRVAGFLGEFVEARGALPEFGPNGKWTWLLTKASSELRGYMGQTLHPALCTGAPEMMDFYNTEFSRLKRRSDDAQEMAASAREILAYRHKTWQATIATTDTVKPTPQPMLTMIKAVADWILNSSGADAVAVEANILAALAQTKASLPGEGASGKSTPYQYRAALALLRALELAVYAELVVERYQPLNVGLFATTGDIRTAHNRSCTCAE